MSTPTPTPTNDESPDATVRDAPAFDFYPERWLVGVASLSDAEQLSYLRLLCHQWLQQGLPADVPALKRLGGKGVTPAVLAKLPLGTDGRRRNARLEIIRTEQRKRIAKASEKARKMAASRWHKNTPLPPEPDAAADDAAALPVECMHPHAFSDAAALPVHCQPLHSASSAALLHAACPPPTADHPPPTSVPEDANNAGACAHEAGAAACAGRAAPAPALHAMPPGAAAQPCTPDLPTVQAWASAIGCPPDKAEIWWHEHEARPLTATGRWTDRDGNAVQRPQHALSAWWQKWRANDQQRSTRLHAASSAGYQTTARPATLRSDTANRPGRYA